MKHTISLIILLLISLLITGQQKPIEGKAIRGFGKTYVVKNPDFKTDVQNELLAVFDIGRTFKDSTKVNPLINTAARYLNMHDQAGVAAKNVKAALVIHGNAANNILNNKKHRVKFGIDNPNSAVIKALSKKGVQIILCGQTAAYRGISKEDALPEIQFALSAMTALVQLQNENYRLINF